jgi:hypothetical protein
MNEQRFPGFSAEASLYKTSRFYMARLGGASFSFNGEQVRPAQIGLGVREVPNPWERLNLQEVLEGLRRRSCDLNAPYSQCYQNCIKNWPGYSAECISTAATCCKYGYHCTYCCRDKDSFFDCPFN